MEKRSKDIEYSGIYNISAKDQSFDIVISKIEDTEKYPMFILLDLLRILKIGGKLLLSATNLNQEMLAMAGINAADYNIENKNWIIEKNAL